MDAVADIRSSIELPRRVLLLLTPRTYRANAFIKAAGRLGIEVIKAMDMHHQLAEYWNYPLGLDFSKPLEAVEAITAFAAGTPLGAVVAVDDSGSLVAALASQALALPHNAPDAAEAARDKHVMRQLLARSGVQAPVSQRYHFADFDSPAKVAALAQSIDYPCVLKPLNLSGSRGVIRANDAAEFTAAAGRLRRLLTANNLSAPGEPFLVEQYIPGREVALEGLLDNGQLRVLALFDKPDPLDGPFFEETIYVTPSRLPEVIQEAIVDCTADAAAALGLRHGSVHAELRLNEQGPWLIELAGRSIGGLCSNTLRFSGNHSLEELILRQAFGLPTVPFKRQQEAGGVMMIPIPEAGLLKSVQGCEAAAAVPMVESVEITARINYSIRPLPEGDSYLGFIFARGDSAAAVEAALRQAHSKLSFEIAPELPLIPVNRH